jgi:hypothetical protein
MIRSTSLIPWLKQKAQETPVRKTIEAHFSRQAIRLYDKLTFNGLFDEWLMLQDKKSGFVRLMRTY